MRIGVDAVTPGESLRASAGGMRMYITALSREMVRLEPASNFAVFEPEWAGLGELEGIGRLQRVLVRAPVGRAARIVFQNTVYGGVIRRARLDVRLDTCNVVPLGAPQPSVVVLQSLQYFDHPEAYGRLRGAYLRAAARHAVRVARLTICVSEESARLAERVTGVARDRVRVVHHGVPPAISGWKGEVERPSPPRILCVATLYRYKNLERLIRAFGRLRRQGLEHQLRVVGGEADVTLAELSEVAATTGVSDAVEFAGAVPHSEMAAEYAAADLFVYPSLQETFGLPPIEAMTLGVPVVAARASAIPEIVGQAAELVDPLDEEDIARGMAAALSPDRRRELVAAGRRRAAEFTWEASARRTLAALKEAAG